MKRQFRGRTGDMIAMVLLLVLGLATTLVIFSQQKAALPSWVPVLGQDFFELRAEFRSAQAVTPGQGQAIDIAGIQVGKVGAVELENGHAVVRMDIEPRYAELIHDDAQLLLRPKTGLNDMVVEVDPGIDGELVSEGDTIPLAQSLPNVNPDEVLATLDADTREYLILLLQGGAEGLGGRGEQLSAGLRRFEPTARDLAKIGAALAERRTSIARVIHNFRLIAEELAGNDAALAQFVDSSNAVLRSFANQEASIRAALRRFPSALSETRTALAATGGLSRQLTESLPELTLAAEALKPGLESTQRLFTETTPPIRDDIRPFTRIVRRPVRHLIEAADPLRRTASGLRRGFRDLNYGLNELAFNPAGSREGFLFFLSWLNHNFNAIFFTEDAGGPLRRGVVLVACSTAQLAEGVASARPFLQTLLEVTRFPPSTQACAP